MVLAARLAAVKTAQDRPQNSATSAASAAEPTQDLAEYAAALVLRSRSGSSVGARAAMLFGKISCAQHRNDRKHFLKQVGGDAALLCSVGGNGAAGIFVAEDFTEDTITSDDVSRLGSNDVRQQPAATKAR